MKYSVRIYTVIPDEKARSYAFLVDAETLDQAQIQMSRKIAHDWVEIPDPGRPESHSINVRTSYIAAWEVEREEAIELEDAVEAASATPTTAEPVAA